MNKKKSIHKAFREYLQFYYENNRKFYRYPEDKRLSQLEKFILLGWDHLKQNKFQEVMNILEQVSDGSDDYLIFQKYYLLGCLKNNYGEFVDALNYFKKALPYLDHYEAMNDCFNIEMSMFTIYQNLNKPQEMFQILKNIAQYEKQLKVSKTLLEQCYFSYFLLNSELESANHLRQKIHLKLSSLEQLEQVIFYITSFQYFIQKDEFINAKKILDRLAKMRNFQNSSNFLFMKHLINHLLDDKKLYVYEKDFFKDLTLYNQMLVIKYLEENDYHQAIKCWSQLKDKMPHLYGEPFDYKGVKCLFSLCLIKHAKHFQKKFHAIEVKSSKEHLLISLIQQGITNKESLYKEIWGESLKDKSDLMKLKKLVSRVREKMGIQIKYVKNCYKMAS